MMRKTVKRKILSLLLWGGAALTLSGCSLEGALRELAEKGAELAESSIDSGSSGEQTPTPQETPSPEPSPEEQPEGIQEEREPRPVLTQTPEPDISQAEVQAVYTDFLNQGQYEAYTAAWEYPAVQYAMLDVDQDQIPELLVGGSPGEWTNTLLFTFDPESGQVQLVKDIYHYAGLFYSSRHRALVYTETRPSVSAGGQGYFVLRQGQLVSDFVIGWEPAESGQGSAYYRYEDGGKTALTETEKNAYDSQRIQVAFLEIPGREQEEEEIHSGPVQEIAIHNGLAAEASDFMFPYSSQQVLTDQELDTMEAPTIEEMHSNSQMAINEILARYGYTFGTSSDTGRAAAEKFSGKDWYEEARARCTYTDPNSLIADMNEVEKTNIDRINAWQKEHGCYY